MFWVGGRWAGGHSVDNSPSQGGRRQSTYRMRNRQTWLAGSQCVNVAVNRSGRIKTYMTSTWEQGNTYDIQHIARQVLHWKTEEKVYMTRPSHDGLWQAEPHALEPIAQFSLVFISGV